ncbi:MAG: M14 family zinc carboxypeptidase [Candidatus Zixiibacteriota bacterium]
MNNARISGVIFFLIFSFALASWVSGEPIMQARIHLADKAQMKDISSLNLDIAYVEYGRYVDIITNQVEVDRLRSLGYDMEIVHQDVVAFYQSRLDRTKGMGGYHTYSEVGVALDSMHMRYPSITTAKDTIGYSLEGRPIWALKISDNPDVDEDEPEVFYNGLTHAREPIGMEALLYFMWNLLTTYGTDSSSTYLVNNRELWFVPVVNPDGYEYNRQNNPSGGGMWRKNRRVCSGGNYGVDLNRNYGYMWGYDNDGSSPYCSDETYRGSAGFSEPETQVLRDFINGRHFVMTLDNHTYGNDLLYPWGYANLYTSDQNLYVAIADSMSKLNGFIYGTCWEILYPVNGGSIDWEYGDTISKPKILAISPEIGTQDDGFWPPSNRILPLCQLELSAQRLYAGLADNPYKILPPTAPVLAGIDTVAPDFSIFWSHHDIHNPASVFELKEMSGFERITYDVESGYSDWDLKGFSISTARSHSATHSFYSGQGDNLNNKVTGINSIKVLPNDSLKMWCWYYIETDWDYAYVEISTDGGTSFFSIPGSITTSYNPNGHNQGNGITGYTSGGWVQGKFSLAAYAGQEIYLRLHYVTDGNTYYEGFYADDIFPFERYSSVTSLSNAIPDTSYQISGHSPGTFFYEVRAKDAQNQWGAYSNVQKAVVISSSFVRGDANSDGIVTVGDVVYVVNYLYFGGSAPNPPAAGDANSDGQTNSGDIVYLVNYLFRGGPSPTQ